METLKRQYALQLAIRLLKEMDHALLHLFIKDLSIQNLQLSLKLNLHNSNLYLYRLNRGFNYGIATKTICIADHDNIVQTNRVCTEFLII